ncbi:MAG: B12-binding domain-containing protein [Candidatus Limnocylindrales bacterium]
MRPGDILIDALTFPIATGQEETRRDGIETLEAIAGIKSRHPQVQTTLGLSNVSFGLNPAARQVLNSVFLNECVRAGLDSAIVHASKILPMSKIPDEQREVALDMVYDRRREGYDPLQRFLQLFEGVDVQSTRESRAAELAALPLTQRLERRIVDGERNGLEADLDLAMTNRPPLEIVNDTLLAGMKTVGDLFGSGEMQLPFVLQSAEVMKAAVGYLEPHMERADEDGKGRIVLATVKGDVHDIGKNLVDIILSNNGYDVVNLGIKQPISAIIDAAEEQRVDVIGMSGLLVKSTVIMKENLQELNSRGLAAAFPVLLGGAALTRAYVEGELSDTYDGEVRYARDAFEGLRLMEAMVSARRQGGGAAPAPDPRAAERQARRERSARIVAERRAAAAADGPVEEPIGRSDVSADNPVPVPPFWGSRVVRGIALADYAALLDERATFMGQWGLRGGRGSDERRGPTYEELVETEGRPRLRHWLDRLQTDNVLEAAVVLRLLPVRRRGRGPGRAARDRGGPGRRAGPLHLPPPAPGPPVCAWPTSSAARTRARSTSWPSTSSRWARGSAGTPPTCSPPTPTATIWRCTGCPCSSPRRWPSSGTGAPARSCVSPTARPRPARTPPTSTRSSGRATAASRYSFGYPACPNLEDQRQVIELLDPARIGVELSEEFQLHPEQSTSAIIVHHPEAKYFNAR